MNYEDSRHLFENGDVVFFSRGRKNMIRRIIRWFTRGSLYHVGIVFWMVADAGEPRLMLAEAQPEGYRVINLGFYRDRDMTVFRSPAPWHLVGAEVIDHAGELSYNMMDMIRIGFHERWGIALPKKSGTGYVCSVVISRMLRAAGVQGIEEMVSPQRLHDQMASSMEHSFFVLGDLS